MREPLRIKLYILSKTPFISILIRLYNSITLLRDFPFLIYRLFQLLILGYQSGALCYESFFPNNIKSFFPHLMIEVLVFDWKTNDNLFFLPFNFYILFCANICHLKTHEQI